MYRSIKTVALAATLTILGAATLTARSAEAQNLYGGFDVGAGTFDYETIEGIDPKVAFEDSATGYGLHFGFRPNRSTFGFEVSFAQHSADKKNYTQAATTGTATTGNLTANNEELNYLFGDSDDSTRGALIAENTATLTSESKSSTIGIDAFGYFPLSGAFEALGTAGIASRSFETDYSVRVKKTLADAGFDDTKDASRTVKLDGIGFRVGIGGQFAFGDRFNVRGLVRYELPGGDLKDRIKSLTSFEVGVNLLF